MTVVLLYYNNLVGYYYCHTQYTWTDKNILQGGAKPQQNNTIIIYYYIIVAIYQDTVS